MLSTKQKILLGPLFPIANKIRLYFLRIKYAGDEVICNHVFQYIEDDKTAMRNAYNLMKPGGWGIMQVPMDRSRPLTYEDNTITDPIEREKAFGLKEHVRFYGLDYADKLRNAGF